MSVRVSLTLRGENTTSSMSVLEITIQSGGNVRQSNSGKSRITNIPYTNTNS